MPTALVERMRRLKHYHDLSASGVVEHALLRFLAGSSELELGERLRSLGAGRRRPPEDPNR